MGLQSPVPSQIKLKTRDRRQATGDPRPATGDRLIFGLKVAYYGSKHNTRRKKWRYEKKKKELR
jgi:hypothetical protein